jgi:(p)ppGpp synthase/HD superfamily hydrolase
MAGRSLQGRARGSSRSPGGLALDFAQAVGIAARVYGATRDASDGLFLAHAVDVAQALGPAATPAAMNTAVLHGIPEDTAWTVEHLAESGVDAVVCEAVDLLTRRSGEASMSYVRRVCDAPGAAGETARLVLVADLKVSVARTDSDALRERYESSLPLVQRAVATAIS